MRQINIHQAKTHLSRLVEEAAKGDPFVIAKAGRPIAKVVPLGEVGQPGGMRELGLLKGKIAVPDDFDTLGQDEIIRMFYGED